MAFQINFNDEHGDDPVTTLQKLRVRNLDIATIASCAPPNERMGVRGCTQWTKCPFKFKGNGPRWVGMQRIYPSGERKDRIKACFAFVRQRERHLDQGDVWRVVAHEGDPFVWRVTEATGTDAKGNKVAYREVVKTDFVPHWPEPEEHPRLRRVLYAGEAFKELEDEQQQMQQAEALSNMTGHDPSFWMKPQGPVEHGAKPRGMDDGGDQADPGGGQAQQAPEAPSPTPRGGQRRGGPVGGDAPAGPNP